MRQGPVENPDWIRTQPRHAKEVHATKSDMVTEHASVVDIVDSSWEYGGPIKASIRTSWAHMSKSIAEEVRDERVGNDRCVQGGRHRLWWRQTSRLPCVSVCLSGLAR
jgi:hypothetical protein